MPKVEEFNFFIAGAGLPRTGTSSLKTALEILLPGKCMHMKDVFINPKPILENVLSDDVTDNDFKDYFIQNNVVAGVDMPFIIVYKKALEMFPEAKCVLTIREADTWVKSMQETVCSPKDNNNSFTNYFYTLFFAPKRKQIYEFMATNTMFSDIKEAITSGNGIKFYNDWVADVMATVPKDRLLVFDVKEGWEPLCRFLNVGIPNETFPRINDSSEFKSNLKRKAYLTWSTVLTLLIVIPIGVGITYKYWMKKLLQD